MRDLPQAEMPADAAAALTAHTQSDNEILRSAAIKALTGLGVAPALALPLLSDALLDEDPDVRSDAMEAFAARALPEHAPLLMRSLEGDPVREVKRAAIEGLARLRAGTALPLLRRLTLSRSDDTVAWEDALGDWEDWLDIQIAAIDALGEMRATTAVDDMMAARDDEMGQTLDTPVFQALAKMGQTGVTWLLAILETEQGLARRRALETLCRLGAKDLADHMDMLLASPDAGLRARAASLLPPTAAQLAEMAVSDAAPEVRSAAVTRAASAQPGLVEAALRDPAPAVVAAALDVLPETLSPEIAESLGDNLLVWLQSPSLSLLSASIRALGTRAPEVAKAPLLALIADTARPLEPRITATRVFCALSPETEVLAGLLSNPAQQVRTTVLIALKARAAAGETLAEATLAEAISGTLLAPDAAVPLRVPQADGPDMTVPKDGDTGPRRIRISRTGDILEDSQDMPSREPANSTLSGILAPGLPPDLASEHAEDTLAEDTPEEAPGKRRKRRPVEGPDAISAALSVEAVQTCGTLPLASVEAACLDALAGMEPPGRQAVWRALAARTGSPGAGLRAAAETHARDDDPVIRFAALQIRAQTGLGPEDVAAAMADPDALIRVAGLAHLGLADALAHLADPALVVRQSAVDRVLDDGTEEMVRHMATRLAEAERADTLAHALARSRIARLWLYEALARPGLGDRAAFILLDAAGRLEDAPPTGSGEG